MRKMLYIIRQYASDGFADYDKKESKQWKGNEKMAELDIPDETILLIPDVAAVLKCSDGYVRRLIKEGKLAAYQVGKTYRIPRKNLIDYIDKLSGGRVAQLDNRTELFSKKR